MVTLRPVQESDAVHVGMVDGETFETAGLNQVELEDYHFNPRARRGYEKVGFVFEGTKKQALIWDGERVDADLVAILAKDWAVHHGRP